MLAGATTGPRKGREYRCGLGLRKLAKARLDIQLNGGDLHDPNWPRETSRLTCRRYLGPVFTPGRRYRVQMRVKWGAHMDGALEVWIDGTKYVDVKRVSNVWLPGLDGRQRDLSGLRELFLSGSEPSDEKRVLRRAHQGRFAIGGRRFRRRDGEREREHPRQSLIQS